jgi:hypothetical protein
MSTPLFLIFCAISGPEKWKIRFFLVVQSENEKHNWLQTRPITECSHRTTPLTQVSEGLFDAIGCLKWETQQRDSNQYRPGIAKAGLGTS